MYKSIIFDVDGTILNPEEGIISSVNYTIKQTGLVNLSEQELKEFVGPPVQNSFQRFYNISNDKAQELANVFRLRYKNKDLLKAKPYDGIFETLQNLKDKKFKLGVATYKREDYAITLLNQMGFNKYFEVICGGDNENKLKKVDIIKLCVEKLNIPISECLMVGDSIHDFEGAQSLNMKFLGVTYGFGFKKQEKLDNSCIGLANNPAEIINIIERIDK